MRDRARGRFGPCARRFYSTMKDEAPAIRRRWLRSMAEKPMQRFSAQPGPRPARQGRRAFTLIEGLLASATLAMLVLAVAAAVSSAQSSTMAGQKRIMATIVADDLVNELTSLKYKDLDPWDGVQQKVGALKTIDKGVYPKSYGWLGRRVSVTKESITEAGLAVTVVGKRIVVTAFDDRRDLASVEVFIPEPAP